MRVPGPGGARPWAAPPPSSPRPLGVQSSAARFRLRRVKTWPLQGLHCVFPAGLRPGGPHPAGRTDPGTDGGSATTGQERVGDTASGLPGRRELWLPLCTSPILEPKSCAVVVPASGLGCLWEVRVVWAFRVFLCAHVCIFVGLQMGVCGGGVGRGSSFAARGGSGTRPGCLCELALVTGSPANPDPGRVPYVVSDTTVRTHPSCCKGRHRLHARPTCLVCVLLSTSAPGHMEGSEFGVQELGQMWMFGSYRTFARSHLHPFSRQAPLLCPVQGLSSPGLRREVPAGSAL